MDLRGIEAIHGRAEELSRTSQYRESYDICISRAVASLDTLCEYCIPFVKVGGYFISMKGPDVEEELKNSEKAIKVLGGKLIDKKIIKIPESDIEHSLLIIEKYVKLRQNTLEVVENLGKTPPYNMEEFVGNKLGNKKKEISGLNRIY